MNAVKYFLFVTALFFGGYVSAYDARPQLSGVFKYVDQDVGSNKFYGIGGKGSIGSGLYVGIEILFPSGGEIDHLQTAFAIKEYGGLTFSYQSSITEHVYYELALLAGYAMAEKIETYGDASGICDCVYGILEPSIRVFYQLTPAFSVGGLVGVLTVSGENETLHVSGLEAVLRF